MNQTELKNAFQGYDAMSSMLKTHSYEEILKAAAELAGMPEETLEQHPMGGYSKGDDQRRLPFCAAGPVEEYSAL